MYSVAFVKPVTVYAEAFVVFVETTVFAVVAVVIICTPAKSESFGFVHVSFTFWSPAVAVSELTSAGAVVSAVSAALVPVSLHPTRSRMHATSPAI